MPLKSSPVTDHDELRDLMRHCISLSPAEQASFLEKNLQGRDDLRTEIEAMLATYDKSPVVQQQAAAPPPEIISIGRYSVVRHLGSGGMANVYLANLKGVAGFSKQFAIKLLLPNYAKNAAVRQLFEYEAKITSALNHPNIVQVYEFCQSEDLYYLVMEYINGRSVGELINELCLSDRLIPWRAALHIVETVCHALDYAHFKRVDNDSKPLKLVHRDITPRNIMLSQEGHVKLMDFGIAKTQRRGQLTAPGSVRGTMRYIAPEIYLGKEADHRSDIFSLAIVANDLLRVSDLYGSESISKQDEVKKIIRKSSAPRPEDRYYSTREMAQDLNNVTGSYGAQEAAETISLFLKGKMSVRPTKLSLDSSQAQVNAVPSIELEISPKIKVQDPLPPRKKKMSFATLFVVNWGAMPNWLLRWIPIAGVVCLGLWSPYSNYRTMSTGERQITFVSTSPEMGECRVTVRSRPTGAALTINEGYFVGLTPVRLIVPCNESLLLSFSSGGSSGTASVIRPTESNTEVSETIPRQVPSWNVAVLLLQRLEYRALRALEILTFRQNKL